MTGRTPKHREGRRPTIEHILQRQLSDAAWDGDLALVNMLLANPDIIPDAFHSTALMHAAHRGHVHIVLRLLPVSDPNARSAEPLWRAARYRRGACVDVLAGVSDTSGWDSDLWGQLPADMQSRIRRVQLRCRAPPE